ncbi:hypothetical protein [Ramlibacter algicola]|uniref:Uncharacterized protein n=1 Tax=Ramlibacter algicola TaxID=2795217 RepID=A0A934UTA0_9BURK|nr:hypothetical protein [Ramlibacter algicola]MBK0394721.1 hypothetical protein [Ramlibacter algicola]
MQQQQPPRDRIAQMQQMSGSSEFQQQQQGQQPGEKPQQMGEGSYEATKDYQERIGRYLEDADVEKDAENAKPRSEEEARELERAEREGQSHSKGEK